MSLTGPTLFASQEPHSFTDLCREYYTRKSMHPPPTPACIERLCSALYMEMSMSANQTKASCQSLSQLQWQHHTSRSYDVTSSIMYRITSFAICSANRIPYLQTSKHNLRNGLRCYMLTLLHYLYSRTNVGLIQLG